MMTSIAVSNQALEYLKDSLADGLSLSRSATSRLTGLTAVALVPEGVSAERATDFKRGGLGRSVIADLAQLLVERFAGATLLLELPLWRGNDPGVVGGEFTVLICGEEVYAVCDLDGSLDSAELTLRAADPSFMYNAFVIRHRNGESGTQCPAEWLEVEDSKLVAVIVGAYDGEGFILASMPD